MPVRYSNGTGPAEVVEKFVYDGQHIAMVFDDDGTLTHRYLYGPGIDMILADEAFDGATGNFLDLYWMLGDHQGSVTSVLSHNSGQTSVVQQLAYTAFGAIGSVKDGQGNNVTTGPISRFAYTGREFDPETGDYYYRARYYDPQSGRFLSQDPIGFAAGDMNLYRYVGNSSPNFVDPSGLRADQRATTDYPLGQPGPVGPIRYNDGAGRETSRTYPNGTRVTQSYDGVGNRVLLSDSAGQVISLYNIMNQPAVEVHPLAKTIARTYDLRGKQNAMYLGGEISTYTYDPLGRPRSIQNGISEMTTYLYDSAGRASGMQLANGTRSSYSYDAGNRLTLLANLKPNGTTLSSFAYTLDPVGNRTGALVEDGNRITWTYDVANQLVNERRSGTSAYNVTHIYDAAGNRLFKDADGARYTYTYDAANQVTTEITPDPLDRSTFTHDADGNLVANGNGATLTWDFENRPTRIAIEPVVTYTATYDGDHRRTGYAYSGMQTADKRVLWDGWNPLAEMNPAGTIERQYTYQPSPIGQIVSMRQGSASSFYHPDAIGTICQVTDSSANVANAYLLTAYGEEVSSSQTVSNALQFIGALGYQQEIPVWAYVRRRYYVPGLARWISRDPLGVRSLRNSDHYLINGSRKLLFYYLAQFYRMSRQVHTGPISVRPAIYPIASLMPSLETALLEMQSYLSNPDDSYEMKASLLQQSINLYSYANNQPAQLTDPYGLMCTALGTYSPGASSGPRVSNDYCSLLTWLNGECCTAQQLRAASECCAKQKKRLEDCQYPDPNHWFGRHFLGLFFYTCSSLPSCNSGLCSEVTDCSNEITGCLNVTCEQLEGCSCESVLAAEPMPGKPRPPIKECYCVIEI